VNGYVGLAMEWFSVGLELGLIDEKGAIKHSIFFILKTTKNCQNNIHLLDYKRSLEIINVRCF